MRLSPGDKLGRTKSSPRMAKIFVRQEAGGLVKSCSEWNQWFAISVRNM